MSRTGCRTGMLALLLAGCAGCAPGKAEVSRPETRPGAESAAPSMEELKNATYHALGIDRITVTLSGGRWTGKGVEEGASRPEVTLVEGMRATGDLDGDGRDEAAVLLAGSWGGSGTFTYLAVAARRKGSVDNPGTALLGDRVQVRDMKILDGRIFVDLVQAGPQDAACCPGELATRGWTLGKNGLTEFVSAAKTSRLSLETITGVEWVLAAWDLEAPAPSRPEVTLRFEEGRLAGSGGCNRYFASVTQGPAPGDLSVGPAGATRMGCPEPARSVESRYLSLLTSVRKFGFLAGRLALSYEKEGTAGALLFEARRPAPLEKGPSPSP
jgi:heat shock protein HslJ